MSTYIVIQNASASIPAFGAVSLTRPNTTRSRHIDLPMVSRRLAKGSRPDGLAIGVRTVNPILASSLHAQPTSPRSASRAD